MKRINLFKTLTIVAILITGLGLQSCSDDDDVVKIEQFASFTAGDQSLSTNNTLMVETATFPENGWIVIHRDNGNGGPTVPAIISVPKLVTAGTATDIELELETNESVADGETLWVMLHTDDGILGTYEFNGTNGLDAPLKNREGDVITAPIIVTVTASGSFTASDQDVENNTVIVSSVTLNSAGWVVIHADNGSGGPVVPAIISVPKFLEAGTSTDVAVELLNEAGVNDGDTLWIMLHTDTGVAQEYEFDGQNGLDVPIKDADGNVVTSSIIATTVQPTGSFMASDQTLSQNKVVISSATFNKEGWIVIHKDNGNGGPMVPAIISIPKLVGPGTSTDIVVELEDTATITDGETLWVMLHTDTGISGTYEFDGSNGLDIPIKNERGAVVTAPIEITSASIAAVDQSVTNNQVVIAEVVAAVDGWIVIHNDDGTGNITLPAIIGKTKVMAGVNTNVVIDIDAANTYTVGQKLFPMLHIDEAPIDEYNFPGVDIPEVFGFTATNVIVTSITVQ